MSKYFLEFLKFHPFSNFSSLISLKLFILHEQFDLFSNQNQILVHVKSKISFEYFKFKNHLFSKILIFLNFRIFNLLCVFELC